MDARRRDDELLDEVSRLLTERRNWRDYMSTVLTVISTQSEAGMRAGIQQLLKQLKNGR